ncbi:MAG: GDP-mannose 4,6-dehydratase [Armatimonadetes bacterium]|nr:GDP-mannose 4,6-dehydratase [Armatimonadota bacterium]
MKRALVTGGAGFIGSHLVDSLLSDGWGVTVVDNFDPFYEREVKLRNIAPHLGHSCYELVEADIRGLDQLRSRLRGDYDIIVHLAAKAGVQPSITAPMVYEDVNVLGTCNLLELAREWGVKQFVFASSSSVYGEDPNVPWKEECHAMMPISPYAATKLSGELLGHVYSRLHGIRFLALRFFTVYGPRQRPDLAIRKFAGLIMEDKPVPVYGDGSTRRDYTYISDIIDGVRAAMDYTGSQYEIINLGNSRTVSLMEMVRSLGAAMGREVRLSMQFEQPGDVPHTWADLTKARALLGYAPTTSLDDGLRQFAVWFKREYAHLSRTAAPLPPGAWVVNR